VPPELLLPPEAVVPPLPLEPPDAVVFPPDPPLPLEPPALVLPPEPPWPCDPVPPFPAHPDANATPRNTISTSNLLFVIATFCWSCLSAAVWCIRAVIPSTG
jgi:hypothetical protein